MPMSDSSYQFSVLVKVKHLFKEHNDQQRKWVAEKNQDSIKEGLRLFPQDNYHNEHFNDED